MITRDAIKDIYPLTPFQEGVLYHHLIDQETASPGEPRAYFQQMSFRLRGPFDPAAFQEAWRHVIARHDILRTVFRTAGRDRPLQIVLKSVPFTLDLRAAEGLSPAGRTAALAALAAESRSRPFALDHAPLMRVACLRFDALDHGVVWDFHHILMDGWCIGVIQDDLAGAYRDAAAGRRLSARPALPYGAFVQWVEARRGGAALAFWARYLAGYETALDLPGQRAVPLAGPRDPRIRALRFDAALTGRLSALAQAQGVTPNTLLQGLWGVLLAKHNHGRDVVFGSVASTRPPELAGSDSMLGPCIGLLPLRVRYEAGDSFRDLLGILRERTVDWLDNVHCALTDIQAQGHSGGAGRPSELFGHYFVYENYPLDARFKGDAQELAPGVTIGDLSVFMASNYDFCLRALPGDELLLEFEHNTRIVDPAVIDALAERLHRLALAVVERPDAPLDGLSLLSPSEQAELRDRWSQGAPFARLATTVPERRAALLAEGGDRGGDRPALRAAGVTLTHRALQDRAEALARELARRHGVAAGSAVAVRAQPGEPMLRGMLACLLLGAAFVPLDPALPAARVRHMLADSYAVAILTDRAEALAGMDGGLPVIVLSADDPIADAAGIEALPPVPADAPAYIIYTSGTTGAPKGVRVGQASLLNYVGWLHRDLGVGAESATALVTSAAFDLGYTGLFGALLLGGCLTLLDEEERRDPDRVMRAVVEDRLTFLKMTPSYLSLLLASPAGERFAEADSLSLVLLGGEPQNFADLGRLRRLRPGLRLVNHYGPTEATIGCVAGPLDDLAAMTTPGADAPQRIGRPVAGARVWLCDHALTPVPPGVPGELLVGGESLAQGYVNPAPADAARFTTLPWAGGARVYRTGDFARWQADGSLVFLGRRDDQVKVRGHRVSLGGIEAALRAAPGVKDAVVLLDRVAPERTDLVAFLILAETGGAAPPSLAALRADLAARLPDAMIPNHIVPVTRFPVTANGKVDRAALAAHRRVRPEAPAADDDGGGTATEETLRRLWAEILFVERVGLDDDFYGLGGHSIKAIQMVAKLRAALKVTVTIRDLFDHPTPRRLAARLETLRGGGKPPAPGALLALRPAPAGAPAVLFLPQGLGTATVYKELALALSAAVACWGVQCPGFDSDQPFAPSMAALADHCAAQATTLTGAGPLRLVGWSFGAHLAVETARRLERAGRDVHLVLIDAAPRLGVAPEADEPPIAGFAELRGRPYWGRVLAILMDSLPAADVARLERLALHNAALLAGYAAAGPVRADITAIEATDVPVPAGMQGFAALTAGRVTVHRVSGDHYSLFHPPHLARVLALLDETLAGPLSWTAKERRQG